MPIGGLIVLAILWFKLGTVAFFTVLALVVAGFVVFFIAKSENKKVDIIREQKTSVSRAAVELDLCRHYIEPHLDELAIKAQQLKSRGSYGVVDTKKWKQEKRYFISRVLSQDLLPSGLCFTDEDAVSNLIDECIASRLASDQKAAIGFSDKMDPIAYEHWCAAQLNLHGWDARVTQASGDQGADVIARKSGLTVAIQCKLYSGSVGNSAVQEVHAAKGFYKADKAVVVSNSTFTNSAYQAAGMLGVLLLHHDQLQGLADKVLA